MNKIFFENFEINNLPTTNSWKTLLQKWVEYREELGCPLVSNAIGPTYQELLHLSGNNIETDKKVVRNWDGKLVFEGEETKKPEPTLEELKQEKIKELKQNCQDYIYSVYPIYKQMNIINPLSDYSNEDRTIMNSFLDNQRAICNEKEKQINEAKSREKLNMIVIDFEKVES